MNTKNNLPENIERITEILKYVAALQPQESNQDAIPLKDKLLEGGLNFEIEGVSFPSKKDSSQPWVRVSRVQLTEMPSLPEELIDWVIIEDNVLKSPIEPKLRKRIDNLKSVSKKIKSRKKTNPEENISNKDLDNEEIENNEEENSSSYLFLRNLPEIEEKFNQWMIEWKIWAEKENKLRLSAQIYQLFYQMFRELTTEGQSESREVVCGFGHILWNIRDQDSGSVVKYSYPLILQKCEIRLAEGDDYPLELWPLSQKPDLHLGRLGSNNNDTVDNFWNSKILDKNTEELNPFNINTYSSIVSGIVARLDASGAFHSQIINQLPESNERLNAYPWITFFQKKKSQSNLLNDLKKLEYAIKNANDIPEILINLVDRDSVLKLPETLPAFRGIENFSNNNQDAKDLYFPLPYNEEQIQVAQRLEVSNGVVVQGPPGTGKSHTIANIVSHYLANGKRILVSSHGSAALSAVREKIPDSLRDLTVALLNSETDSLAEFEKSVREIADRLATFNVNNCTRIIKELEVTVNNLFLEVEKIDNKILEQMNTHHEVHMLNGTNVTLMELARFYSNLEPLPNWIGRVPTSIKNNDTITNGYTFPCLPNEINEETIQALRQARIDAGLSFPLIFDPISDPSNWPKTNEILNVINANKKLKSFKKDLERGVSLAQTKPMDKDAIWSIKNDISSLIPLLNEFKNIQTQSDLLDSEVRKPSNQEECILEEEDDINFCNKIIALRDEMYLLKHNISYPFEASKSIEYKNAVVRGMEGNPPLGNFFQKFKADKQLKDWIENTTYHNKKVESPEEWAKIDQHLKFVEEINEYLISWQDFVIRKKFNLGKNSVDENKSLVIINENIDIFQQIDFIAKQAQYQLTRSNWRKNIAIKIENILDNIFIDPINEENQKQSKWTRNISDKPSVIHLRNKTHVTEDEDDNQTIICAPWKNWDKKTDIERDLVISIAEKSLNLMQNLEQEQDFINNFKENTSQLLEKTKVMVSIPEIPKPVLPPNTRQVIQPPQVTLMDKVKLFLEKEIWEEARADYRSSLDRNIVRSSNVDQSTETLLLKWKTLLNSGEKIYQAVILAGENTQKGLSALINNGFGDWARSLLKNPIDNLPNSKRVSAAIPDDKYLPKNWKEIVQQAQIHSFLEGFNDQNSLMNLFSNRKKLIKSLSNNLSELAAEKAWFNLSEIVTPRQRQALGAYLSAVRAVGSGNGKRSLRHQQDARVAMEEAFSAVPCWIMTTSKVSEVMPSELELFDLVIIDEASQSDLSALPALIRGKKILIVGDDKQVSPSNFVQEDLIMQQRRTLLANQPFAPLMAPDRSIYDLFSGVLPNSSIMLREHFRCVQPIISWSNKLYYHNKMIPLRIPSGAERLDPPLIDILVEDGKMVDDVNEAEAIVIAREIQAITKNPRLKNKTIGVVTLPSKEAQTNKIRDAIDQHITQGAYINHKILVGPPARFQGSERDIMFVAMTWDANSGGASDRPEFHQRFNVAMSRARDRMILVRSIPDNMLKSGTLLSKVVHHFHDDHDQLIDGGVDECKNDFEKEIFEALTEKGYFVKAHTGPKHAQIDLVVEDKLGRRLAIECDGDIEVTKIIGGSWKENWQLAISNQRILERAGWNFMRLTALSWYLNKEDTLNKIIDYLNELGIEANGLASQRQIPICLRKTTTAFEVKQKEENKVSRFSRHKKNEDIMDI